jgi:hypothetical protein
VCVSYTCLLFLNVCLLAPSLPGFVNDILSESMSSPYLPV